MNVNQERLKYLQNYFDNQLVKVEVPPFRSVTNKGTVIHRFNDTRFNYKFVDGIAMVKHEDLHKFKYPNSPFIIHDTKKGEL